MKHKHYDLIVAWAGGKAIEYEHKPNIWLTVDDPSWSEDSAYRIKQEPKIEVKYFARQYALEGIMYYVEIKDMDLDKWDLKITYQDGEPINFETPKKG